MLRECILTSVLANDTAVQEFMKEISDSDKSEVGSKADGFCQQLNRFDIFFCL